MEHYSTICNWQQGLCGSELDFKKVFYVETESTVTSKYPNTVTVSVCAHHCVNTFCTPLRGKV